MTSHIFWTGLVSLATAVVLTPLVAFAMTRLGVVDRPDGRRKLHGRAVPLAGGVAVWVAVTGAIWAGWRFGGTSVSVGGDPFWAWFLFATFVLCAVGFVDDAFGMRGRHKLIGQIVSVSILIGSGLVIGRVSLFGWDVELGVMAIPFTMLWLLGAVNAMNLIDGMDGLAATVGGMIGLSLCAMAGMNGHAQEAAVAAALVGGLAGFLVYNFPPAKVFLGDAGSMVAGLILGAVAVRSALKGPATFAIAVPVAIWTLPFLDVSMAILRRKLTGRSIYETDRSHLHHRLVARGLGPRKTLLLVAALCGVTMTGALLSVARQAEWLAPASAGVVVAFLVVTRLFGHSECALLARRVRSFAVSFAPTGGGPVAPGREHRSRLQGTREWDELWDSLVAYAERFGLTSVQLDISLPSIHEEFFASWTRRGGSEASRLYRLEIPLSSDAGPLGVLRIAGQTPAGSAFRWTSDLVEGLRPFETQIAELLVPGDSAEPSGDGWAPTRGPGPGGRRYVSDADRLAFAGAGRPGGEGPADL